MAAPQKIVLLASIDEYSSAWLRETSSKMASKLIFLVLTTSVAEAEKNRNTSTRLGLLWGPLLPTLFLLERNSSRWQCFENRDNIFREEVWKQPGDCEFKKTECMVESVREQVKQNSYYNLQMSYYLTFRCNANKTSFQLSMHTRWLGGSEKSLERNSYLSVADNEARTCYTYIPLAITDVTALTKPFQLEVWCLVLTTLLLLAFTWSLIVRGPTSTFLIEASLSIFGVRGVTLLPKSHSSTLIGCSALAFTFLIGRLYSNSVMSCFLDPSGSDSSRSYESKPYPLSCFMKITCWEPDNLSVVLKYNPLCEIPPQMMAAFGRPLQRFPVSVDGNEHEYVLVELVPKFNRLNRWERLDPIRRSETLDRMIRHGIISPSTTEAHTTRFLLERRSRNMLKEELRRKGNTYALAALAVARDLKPLIREPYVSYNTTSDKFDMESFVKLQPLIEMCFLLTIGGISFELFHANKRRIFAICEFLLVVVRFCVSSSLERFLRSRYVGYVKRLWSSLLTFYYENRGAYSTTRMYPMER